MTLEGKKEDGSTYTVPLAHTFNANQIKWFKAGSALNAVRLSGQLFASFIRKSHGMARQPLDCQTWTSCTLVLPAPPSSQVGMDQSRG